MNAQAAAAPIRIGALALLLIVGSLLATSAIFAKAAPLLGWPPLALLQWSMAGAALVQALGNGVWREREMRSPTVLLYAGMSGFLFAVPNALAFGAARHVGAAFVSLCFAFPLVFTYGMALSLGMERLRTARLIGVASGVIGAVLLAGAGATLANDHVSIWVIAALTAPVVIAVGNIFRSSYWPSGARASHLSTGMMVFAFFAMVAINAALGLDLSPRQWTFQSALVLAGQVLIFTIMYDLYFRLQNLAGPVYLSQIGSVAAVVGALLALVFFDEIPGPQQIAAAVCVAVGIGLVSWRRA